MFVHTHLCMYVCLILCVCIYIFIYIYIYKHVPQHAHMHACLYGCVYARVCIFVYVVIHACLDMCLYAPVASISFLELFINAWGSEQTSNYSHWSHVCLLRFQVRSKARSLFFMLPPKTSTLVVGRGVLVSFPTTAVQEGPTFLNSAEGPRP